MRILIVDDNVIDIALVKRELDTSLLCDFSIKTSISVADGLKKLETESFDVILLDYEMPEIDGIEMIIEIRSKPNLGNTAIIVVSASLDSSVALNCIEVGAQDFIPKSSITQVKLYQAIIHSRKRFEMEQKMYESYLSVKTMAEKDPLTGLHNRYFFDENLQMMIAASKRSNTAIGMLALDLDNFKHINDSMGHEAGDLLLKEVVARIKRCLRVNDGFARLGGDEFAITLSNINAIGEINMVTDRITDAFKEPFELSGKNVICTVSIGAALYPNDAASGSELVKCADIAMYRAKQSGKNGVCFYESHYQAEFNRRFTIQNDIMDTLADSSFRLFYQPIFCDQGKDILGFEALIRWPDIANSHFPDIFIPIAEESRLINDIGIWVIRTAIKQLSVWHKKYSENLSMSVNISPMQLHDGALLELLKSITSEYNIRPDLVTLEITETALLEHNDITVKTLKDLSAYGFKIALDDFGMGYSSISHLTNFVIDTVKIDKSMQPTDADDDKRKNLLEALAMMLIQLNFKVVAEGVETEEQLSLCKALHIDLIQGYLLSVPMSAEQVEIQLNAAFHSEIA